MSDTVFSRTKSRNLGTSLPSTLPFLRGFFIEKLQNGGRSPPFLSRPAAVGLLFKEAEAALTVSSHCGA